VKYGITTFPTDYSIAPGDLARAAEERGFESLWVAEHSHIPVDRKAPWPGGDELPKMYYDVMDPFVALAAAAAVTERILLATGVCLVIQRDPIQTAKLVASIDQVSGGRFLFGVGAGWNIDEMENHGTDGERRFKILRERIEAMKAIWTQDKAEYHGEFVDFDPVYAWPKPVQKPHPPIHVGGVFPGAARRALRWGNGWFPIPGRGESDYAALRDQIATLAEAEGRDPTEIEITVFGAGADQAALEKYQSAGVDRVTLFVPPVDRDASLKALDEQKALVDRVG
jgi:probable F420-dependent oxidoreductase